MHELQARLERRLETILLAAPSEDPAAALRALVRGDAGSEPRSELPAEP